MSFTPQYFNNFPKFYYLLDDNDKIQYMSIRDSKKEGYKKNESNFSKEIENLKKFVVRGNNDDWKRGIVCGIYWLPENRGIAINNQQLKIILNRCKSSLNASLAKIGLDVILTRGRATNLVLNTFPFLKNNFSEIRQWTIRQMINTTPLSSSSKIDQTQYFENKKEQKIDIFTPFNDDNNDIFQFSSNDFYALSNSQQYNFYQFSEFF